MEWVVVVYHLPHVWPENPTTRGHQQDLPCDLNALLCLRWIPRSFQEGEVSLAGSTTISTSSGYTSSFCERN
jgi:hypothetical protein